MTVGFHRQSVLFSYEISVRFVLSFYEISMIVGFVLLMMLVLIHHVILMIALFFPLRDFEDSRFSSSVSFVQLRDLSLVRFVLLRDFNDGRF